MDAASDGLAITNRFAARRLSTEGTLEQEVYRLQQAFRSSAIEYYVTQKRADRGTVPGTGEPSTLQLHVTADVAFAPGTVLEMHCVRPSNDVLPFLRLVTLPSHQFFQNVARASGDPAAFGAYVVREWGTEKCFGESMDSGILDNAQLRASVSSLSTQRELYLCALSTKSWNDSKRWVLANEGVPWANEQAYAIQDLRNWMQYGPGLLQAREISRRAAALSPMQVCSLLTGFSAARSNATRFIEVVVPRSR